MVAKDTSKPTVILGQNIINVLQGSIPVTMNGTERKDSNASSTSSFIYDPPTLGLKSTQQLNVDWSRFENHTFFGSAEVNVNVAFDRIINHFPFDGTRREYEIFYEKLTGYENYVLSLFPRNVGYLNFSGGPTGSFISVNDYAGGMIPSLSKTKTGAPVLDPGLGSFSIEMQLLPATGSNDVQVVCQKLSGSNQGFSVLLLGNTDPSSSLLQFSIVSGSSFLSASATLTKGVFNHVVAIYDRTQNQNVLKIFVDESLQSESPSSLVAGKFAFQTSPFIIGSGSAVQLGQLYTPTSTFSGSIDELRVFHSVRTQQQIQNFALKSVYATPDMRLYYRFNEPTGSLDGTQNTSGINNVVLDSSGHSLHSNISNFTFPLRSTGSVPSPLLFEKSSLSPVLFPAFADVLNLNSKLLVSATAYDLENPNIITKLIPPHYFLEGQAQDGLATEGGTITEGYGGVGQPGSGQLGTTQLLLSFLYVWAKFFDELKLFVDAFASVKYVSYDPLKSAPDHFLPLVIKQFGFQIPSMFLDATIEQYIDGENIQPFTSTDSFGLQYVQNQIIRRVLVNMNEIIQSKGTQHSVRAFLRSMGIDPDNAFRIREFGGPTKQNLQHARETKLEPGYFLDFVNGGIAVSPFLSSSRVEPGYPGPGSAFVTSSQFANGVSPNPSDGLFTSGSFTFEGIYRWPHARGVTSFTQSLARMVVTGAQDTGLICNLVAMSSSIPGDQPPSVRFFARPTVGTGSQAPVLVLQLSDVNIFDGGRWNVSFGRERNDSFGSSVSSSYFLRVASQEYGVISQNYTTASYFQINLAGTGSDTFKSINAYNSSGPKLVLGNHSVSSGTYFLNASDSPSESKAGLFNGQVARVRFWSKALTEPEWLEHVVNYKSVGVSDPTTNFNFETSKSGSWERLRLDAAMDQDATNTDKNGAITLLDYSQNKLHMQGNGFPALTNSFAVMLFGYSFISPVFDEASTNDKVRIRSYTSSDLAAKSFYAQVAPIYSIAPNELPTDDTRFAIEFSLMDALNRDIINIFSTLDALDNALGDPDLLFSPDYPNLEVMRNIYFKRLTGKIDVKAFFEFYRWFDTSVGTFIAQLVPQKTKFFGTNFVIESHMLERPKMEYQFADIYLNEIERHNQKDTILVQQIEGVCKKY